ncbi:MAG TPA: DUF5668 domain-containing protein [Thermoanaerobaculia bacterium]
MNGMRNKRIDHSALVWGFLLIGFGVLFLLDQFHIARFDELIRDFWPMIIISLGVAKLFSGRFWAGFVHIGVGAWLQACQLRLFGLTYGNSWPLLLVFMGAAITLRAIIDAMRRHEPAPPEERRG